MKLRDLALYGCLAVSTPFLSGCSPSGDFNPAIKSELIGSGKNSFIYKGNLQRGARFFDNYYLIYPKEDNVSEFNGRYILEIRNPSSRQIRLSINSISNPEVEGFIKNRIGAGALGGYTVKRLSGNIKLDTLRGEIKAEFKMLGDRKKGPCFFVGPETEGKRDVMEFKLD